VQLPNRYSPATSFSSLTLTCSTLLLSLHLAASSHTSTRKQKANTHTHTSKHTYTHTHTSKHTHTHTHTYIYTHTHTHTHTPLIHSTFSQPHHSRHSVLGRDSTLAPSSSLTHTSSSVDNLSTPRAGNMVECSDLDRQIAMLRRCEIITEKEVEQLCCKAK